MRVLLDAGFVEKKTEEEVECEACMLLADFDSMIYGS